VIRSFRIQGGLIVGSSMRASRIRSWQGPPPWATDSSIPNWDDTPNWGSTPDWGNVPGSSIPDWGSTPDWDNAPLWG
jgi:hypothetical protein